MKYVVLLAVVVAGCMARTLNDDMALFNDFKETYGRAYTPSEGVKRFNCFRQTLDTVDKMNAMDTAQHGINAFSDLCADEFKAMYHNLQGNSSSGVVRRELPRHSAAEVQKALATPIDWRTKGAVTHVKNQGQCGSCWTFSAVGNMEGQYFLAAKEKLTGFSEEELVQCAKTAGQGCSGGWMDKAIEWVVNNGGIDTEEDYPYTSGRGRNGVCNEEKKAKYVGKFSAVKHVAQEESEIAATLNSVGPLSIGVDAAKGWQTYRGGVMSTCTGTSIDHGVTLVGYGTSGEGGYWIVKNSWGASWGESGYIRLQYGTNQCGIKSTVCTAQV